MTTIESRENAAVVEPRSSRTLLPPRRKNRSWIAAAVGFVVLVLLPFLGDNSFEMSRYGVAVCYIMAAIGLNLAFGFGGQLALGQTVVMATGAYTAGILSVHSGWGAAAAAPVGIFAGVCVGAVMMLPGLRVRGWYLALISMFSVLVLPKVINAFEATTGGEFGLTGVRDFALFGLKFNGVMLFELTLISLAVIWLGAGNFVNSAWGLRMRAVRDLGIVGEAVGINLTHTRLIVYLLSSIPAAVAGVLLAYTEKFVNAESFGMGLTLLLLTGTVLGGLGRSWGPILGMIPLVAFSFWVGPFSQYNPLILGLGLMICAVVFTDGFVPALEKLWQRVFARAKSPDHFDEAYSHLEVAADSAAAFRSRYRDARHASHELVLRADGVTHSFGGLRALDNVELSLRKGRLCGLVGANGSGKSTFLNAISGFFKPNEGRIVVDNRPLAGLSPYRIAHMGVGRTFQVPRLIEELSVLENIELGLVGAARCSVWGVLLRWPSSRRKARERLMQAEAAFLAVGLDRHLAHVAVAELPLGLKRIVEVGRAIAVMPTLLLLDEPAAGLNNEERNRLGELLVKLKGMDMTVLVVEHNVPFVLKFCDEVVLLRSGQVRCHADLKEPLPKELIDYLNYGLDDQDAVWKKGA